MPWSKLSASTQDYLKCIWTLQEWSAGPVSVTALAEKLGVRTSSASDGVKKLAEQGLVDHVTYGGVTLTPSGTRAALAMVRRHRLLETYLVQELGYTWDEVHDEAEVLEHAISNRLVEALDAKLGHPTRDPHGDPIPSAQGAAHLPDAVLLSHAAPGEYVITRISDADAARLRHFASLGITPDAVLTVSGEGTVSVGGVAVLMSPEDAQAVWLEGN
jgi:DtxR family Mn-dependent transcriptional regulator